MDYPTEEEEFELRYADEMELLNEEDDEELMSAPLKPRPPVVSDLPNTPSTSNAKRQSTPLQAQGLGSPFSPGFSQIPREKNRLFGSNYAPRVQSTPIQECGEEVETNAPLAEMQNVGLYQRKRRLELDLFGDIYDIEREDAMSAKKVKSEEERDIELINKIVEARRMQLEQMQPVKTSNLRQLEALHLFKMQNLSYSVPKWPFVTLKRSNGEKVYVRTHSVEFEANQLAEINVMSSSLGVDGLLGDTKAAVWDEANELVLKKMTALPPVVVAEEVVAAGEEEQELWVEKYKPKKYMDLLSDETTNRSLLQWLKMWDKVVFGREVKKPNPKPGAALNTFNKRTGRFEKNGWVARKNKNDLRTDLDEHGRPVQQIALLCGPPGLGKTTLAHTIARHAGYAIREVNASDDRSPDAFRLALENGTQMQSVLNQDRRPNCMILDEIDGAPQASIEFLLRFVSPGGVGQKYTKKTAGADKKFILKRPIICICNDLYAPALRQLRQVAFIVNFPQLDSGRLAERLTVIARMEHIRTDMTALLALAEKTGNDVRSCLSMLQFHAGVRKPLTLIDVLRSNVGQKDRHKGLFATWSAIFQIQRPQKTIAAEDRASITMTDTSTKTRMETVLATVMSAGDYERLMQGVYENYLQQKMTDPDLTSVAAATDWFCFNDRLQTEINHKQNYSTYPYLAFAFVVWHLSFSSMAWPKLHFPSKGFEANQKLQNSTAVLSSLRKGIGPTTKGVGDGVVLLLDAVPLIKRILCPTLRSVSSQLLTQKERHDLEHAVEVMVDMGLSYKQLRMADGTYQYKIEPDIEHLSDFQIEYPQQLSYWGKQLLAREVDLERMRRAQPKTSGGNPVASSSKEQQSKPAATAAVDQNVPNFLQKLQPKKVSPKTAKETTTRDFFGRVTTKTSNPAGSKGVSSEFYKNPIWYKYKEGFNNAVRKDVTMADLL